MKTNTPDHNSVIAKKNELIGQFSRYTLSEFRLIAYCLSHYDSRKAENRIIEASVDELKSVFNMTTKDAYAVVRQAVKSVNRKPFELETDTTDEEWYIFTGFKYFKREGRFEFRISPDAQPFLLELGVNGNFTRYRLGDVYQFKSASAWKLYELLKRWLSARSWEVEIEELRSLLGVAGKYPRWNNFKQRLIDPAIEEINETSDIKVDYTNIKRGRSVVGIAFQIHPAKPGESDVIDIKTDKDKLYSALIEIGVNAKTAGQYATAAERKDKTDIILNKLPTMAKRSKGGSVQKYVLGAIKAELGQQLLYSDQEAQARDYRNAVKCWEDKGKDCKRRTNTKAVCSICEKIR